jgi:hypothetical protein
MEGCCISIAMHYENRNIAITFKGLMAWTYVKQVLCHWVVLISINSGGGYWGGLTHSFSFLTPSARVSNVLSEVELCGIPMTCWYMLTNLVKCVCAMCRCQNSSSDIVPVFKYYVSLSSAGCHVMLQLYAAFQWIGNKDRKSI